MIPKRARDSYPGIVPAMVTLAVFVAADAANLILYLRRDASIGDVASVFIMSGSFMIVGALILSRQPRNRMGWIYAGAGLAWSTGIAAVEYSRYAYAERSGDAPLALPAAWFAEWYWIPWLFLMLGAGILLFPTGTPPSRRWHPISLVLLGGAAALASLAALDPRLNIEGTSIALDNPIGISPFGDPDAAPLVFVFVPLLFVTAITSLASLVVRFRGSRGEERQQMKWVVYATSVFVVGFIGLALLDALGVVANRPPLLDALVITLPPIAAGLAILKYRLYDIDVIINRTLVYGVLSAFLGLAYGGSIVALNTLLGAFRSGNNLAVAASTLAVAALFTPARRAIQGFIDRRFYRSKYDAERTLTGFTNRLRDHVDLETVASELVQVVDDTMQPARVSVWLRPAP